MKLPLKIILLLSALCLSVFSTDTESLKHYGLLYLEEPNISQKLSERFKTSGNPIFFVHDFQLGVTIGDIIRFEDKVVLIDKNVWKTLQVEGVFNHLQRSKIIQIQAKAMSSSWRSRSNSSAGKRSKKAFKLGAEVLKIFEDYFGKIPKNEELILEFKGNQMVLIAPNNLVDNLPFTQVRKLNEGGQPTIISEPPKGHFLVGDPFQWQLWAIDSRDPASVLEYRIGDSLPSGLTWNPDKHLIEGTPESPDSVGLWVYAENPTSKLVDSLKIDLKFWPNAHPVFVNAPDRTAPPGEVWEYSPLYSDADHLGRELKFEILSMPNGMDWDSTGNKFSWKPSIESIGDTAQLSLKVTDPLGASTEEFFDLFVDHTNHPPFFASELGAWKLQEGQSGSYKPVAFDPDGDSLRYEIIASPNDGFNWDGQRIHFKANKLGMHTALIKAFDSTGNKAQQHITYYVYPEKKIWTGFGIKNKWVGGLQLWELKYLRGSARVGLLSTDIMRTFESDTPFLERHWPFFYIGASVLGHRQLLKGNYAFFDFGFSLRQTSRNTSGGGLMFRIDSRFKSKGAIPGYFEMEFQASANQGIFIVNAFAQDGLGGLSSSDYFKIRFAEGVDSLQSDYQDADNLFTTFRLEGWYPIGYNVWAGPVTWRIDHPLFRIHEQRIGLGLRNHLEFEWLRAVQSLRLGFGGSSAGFRTQYDIQVSLGKWN